MDNCKRKSKMELKKKEGESRGGIGELCRRLNGCSTVTTGYRNRVFVTSSNTRDLKGNI